MKAVIDALSDVPKELQGEYEEGKDGNAGKYVLKLEGTHPVVEQAHKAVENFRNNNTALIKDKATLEAKLKAFEGIDPGQVAADKQKLSEFEKSAGKEPKDVEARIKKAIDDAVGPYAKKVETLEQKASTAERELKMRDVETNLRAAGVKAGIDEKAMPDFLARGRRVFNEDGVAKDGDSPLLSKDKVGDPLGMEEWALSLQSDAPHLFRKNTGGGAGGSGGPGVGKKAISGKDPLEFGHNLEKIIKGDVVVPMGQGS